jgi:hypothetical protein
VPTYALVGHPRKRIYPDGSDPETGEPLGKSYGVGEPFTTTVANAEWLVLTGATIEQLDKSEAKELREEARAAKKEEGPTPAASVPSGT